jgi:transcriptional regulator with XRE-family HTH domain
MDKKPLYERTQALLAARKGSLRRIADESGLGFEWVSNVNQGRVMDPGVKKIQILHDYLVSQQ